MVSYEDLMEKLPSKAVIDAIEKSSSSSSGNVRVIASDVATKAGVSITQARKDLATLASISQGDIAVDKNIGELIYTFPTNLNSVLTQNSKKYQALQTFRQVWPTLFWGVRITFGIALLTSLVAIFSTIFFINSSSSNRDDDRDDRGSGGSGLRLGGSWGGFWGPSPFDFFYYRPYGYYGYYGTNNKQRDPEEMSFLESIFSFVFGDGNPNAQLQEQRLSLAANMIRQNNGAVTAEQLAPFCDDAPNPPQQQQDILNSASDSVYVDEGFVLPIVTALDGEPPVTPNGEIVYTFPNLQMSAAVDMSSIAASSRRIRPGGTSSSSAAITSLQESMLLKRAGLSPRASTMDIKRLLMYNGISTQGALERDDLLKILEKVMPPPTEREQAQLLEAQAVNDPTVLQEREWKFSLASDMNKFLSGGLGVVNLLVVLCILAICWVNTPCTGSSCHHIMVSYKQNAKIQQRNKIRRGWKEALAMALTNSNSPIAKKIAAAKSMKTKMRTLGATKEDLIFDTALPMEEIQATKAKSELDDFDKLLGQSSDTTLPMKEIQATKAKSELDGFDKLLGESSDTALPMKEIQATKAKSELDDFDKLPFQ